MTFAVYLLFLTSSHKHNIDPNILLSVCYVESKWKVAAMNKNDGGSKSIGICQVKYRTAKWLGFRGTEKQLSLPKYNIEYSAKYLKRNLDRYKGDIHKALIAYNQGNANGLTKTKYSSKVIKIARRLCLR